MWVEWQYHQQWRRRRRRRNTGSAKSSSFWFSMQLLSTLSSSIDLFNSLSVPLFLFFIISISQSLLLSLLLFCSTDFFFFLKKTKTDHESELYALRPGWLLPPRLNVILSLSFLGFIPFPFFYVFGLLKFQSLIPGC